MEMQAEGSGSRREGQWEDIERQCPGFTCQSHRTCRCFIPLNGTVCGSTCQLTAAAGIICIGIAAVSRGSTRGSVSFQLQ